MEDRSLRWSMAKSFGAGPEHPKKQHRRRHQANRCRFRSFRQARIYSRTVLDFPRHIVSGACRKDIHAVQHERAVLRLEIVGDGITNRLVTRTCGKAEIRSLITGEYNL